MIPPGATTQPKQRMKDAVQKANCNKIEFKNLEHFGTRTVLYTLSHTNWKFGTVHLILSFILFYPIPVHVTVRSHPVFLEPNHPQIVSMRLLLVAIWVAISNLERPIPYFLGDSGRANIMVEVFCLSALLLNILHSGRLIEVHSGPYRKLIQIYYASILI